MDLHVDLVELLSSTGNKVSRQAAERWLSEKWPPCEVTAHLDRLQDGAGDVPVTVEDDDVYLGPYAVADSWSRDFPL
jgi:hypothetical protein